MLTLFKNRAKLAMCFSTRIDKRWLKVQESLSDVIARTYVKRVDSLYVSVLYVWRRGLEPKLIEVKENYIDRIRDSLKKLVEIARVKAREIP